MMPAALSHILILAIGIALHSYLRRTSIRSILHPWDLALSYIIGEFACIISLLVSSILGMGLNISVLLVLMLVAWATQLRPNDTEELVIDDSPTWSWYLLTLLVLLLVIRHTAEAFFHPLAAWDARSIWFFHAKAIYFDKGISLEFLKNPAYLWSHPDYPPAIPLLAAYHSYFLGEWSEVYAKSFLFFHWLCSLLALAGSCKRRGALPVTVAFTLIFLDLDLGKNCIQGYADAFLAILLVLAIFQENRMLRIVLLSFCALVKSEALVFALIFYLSKLVLDSFSKKSIKESLLGLSVCFPWKVFCWISSIKGEYSWSVSSLIKLPAEQYLRRTQLVLDFALDSLILQFGLSGCALLAMPLVLAPLIAIKFSHKDLFLFWLVYLGSALATLVIYITAPIPVPWLLENSFARVVYSSVAIGVTLLTISSAATKTSSSFSK